MRGIAKGAENKKGTYLPLKKLGVFSYVLTQTDVSNIKKDGLVITGEGVTITRVYFESAPEPVILVGTADLMLPKVNCGSSLLKNIISVT